MKIWIFDDLHWEEIYNYLNDNLPWFSYPVKKNVKDPLPFLNKINDWDLILLDNFFDWREWPLWNDFLWEILKTDLDCKIVAISDFWKKLNNMFKNWSEANNKWYIVWRVKSKKWEDIYNFLNLYFWK